MPMSDERYREELKDLLYIFIYHALTGDYVPEEYIPLIPSLISMLITLTNSEDQFNY